MHDGKVGLVKTGMLMKVMGEELNGMDWKEMVEYCRVESSLRS